MQLIKIFALLILIGSFHAVQATSSSPQEDGDSFTGSSDESSSNSFAEFSKVFALLSIPHEDGESSTSSSDNDSFLMTKEHFQPTNKRIFSSIRVIGELYHNQYNLLFKVTKKEFDEIVAATGLKMHFQANEKGLMDLILENEYSAQVRLAQDAETGEYVTVKFISSNKYVDESLRVGEFQERLAGESHILPLLDYVHYTSSNDETIKAKLLKKIFGHTKDKYEALLLQFAPLPSLGNGEDLEDYLSLLEDDDLKTKIVTHVAYSFVTRLMNMHNREISHLDFKLVHLRLNWQGDVWVSGMDCAEEKNLLSGGFGDRRNFSPERLAHVNYLVEKQKDPGNIKANDPRKFYSGPAADSFAAGLAIRELMTDNHLSQDLFDQKQEGLFKVINGLLLPDPKERWSTVQAQKALRKLLPKESPKELFTQFEQAVQASLTESAKYEEKQYAYYQQISPETKETDYTDFLEEGPFCTDIPDEDPTYTTLPNYDHTSPQRRDGKGNQEDTDGVYQ